MLRVHIPTEDREGCRCLATLKIRYYPLIPPKIIISIFLNSVHEELCSESNFILGVGILECLICASVLAFGGCNPLLADGKRQPNGTPCVTPALSGADHKWTLHRRFVLKRRTVLINCCSFFDFYKTASVILTTCFSHWAGSCWQCCVTTERFKLPPWKWQHGLQALPPRSQMNVECKMFF